MTSQTNMHEHDHVHEHSDELLAQVDDALHNPERMKYWRSIEHQERTKAYVESIRDEFRNGDSEISGLQRRDMLKLMGASFALAGVGVACRRPEDKIMPYTEVPEDVIPGIPNHFATARPSIMGATGLVVESHEGRPTKVEGNPEHPFSLGRASAHDQAAVLELYDPDRSRVPMIKASQGYTPATWTDWDTFAQTHFSELAAIQGRGLALLLNGEDSPTLLRLKSEIQTKYPEAVFFAYNPLALTHTELGAELVFGANKRVLPLFENAKVILTLQADPLMQGAGALRNARGFGEGRKVYAAKDAVKMNRLYAVEATYSITGTNADHRLRLAAADTAGFLKALANELLQYEQLAWSPDIKARLSGLAKSDKSFDTRFIKALAKDLVQNIGQSLIVVGEGQPAAVHGLAHTLNSVLRGTSKTFKVIDRVGKEISAEENSVSSLAQLVQKLNAGEVSTLVIVDANPAYASPGSLGFVDSLKKAKTIIHLGLYQDETGNVAHWQLPMAHFLEAWGDARAYDGTVSIVQPLIAPLHDGRSAIEILAQISSRGFKKGFDLVAETWRSAGGALASEKTWRKSLHDGIIAGSAFADSNSPLVNAAALEKGLNEKVKTPSADNLEVVFNFDYSLLDGRFANLGWLQELPDPITKLAWDNALLVSQTLAKQLGIKSRVKDRLYEADVVTLALNGKSVDLPTFVMPGLADYSVIAFFGYGRSQSGLVGNGVGVNIYPIWPVDGAKYAVGATIKRLGRTQTLATTQEQFAMNGDAIQDITTLTLQNRDPVRDISAAAYVKDADYTKKKGIPESLLHEEAGSKEKVPMQMTQPWLYTGNKWGMVIDLSSCIGCNACVSACQSENNTPVVGRTQVMRSRSMQWIRVDRYFTGDVVDAQSVAQPVPCMHCENAPCEPVCPVAATAHDSEGLNVMAYNRCVGTRYCGNNCPYKVRRFNYLDYTHSGNLYVDAVNKERNVLLQMQKNPDVTVRYRGVMEKCTYCTQRIQEAKMTARRNKQDVNNLPDGAVTPACAQTCPTQAITFGNLNDENSRVSQLKNVDRNYDLLKELNVRPRTSYLAKVRNPNPELV